MNVKDWVGISQGIITTLAIIFGGIWLVFQRLLFSRLEIKHDITQWPINDGKVLIRLSVTIKNIGVVLLRLFKDAGFIRVSTLSLSDGDNLRMSEDRSIFIRNGEGPWLDRFEWKLSGIDNGNLPIVIEPGESDEFHFDFILPMIPSTISIYTYICAKKQKFRPRLKPKISLFKPFEIGWHLTSLYNIACPENQYTH